MSNRWTRVPPGQPPLDGLQLRLLPIADLFMGLMWSRPGGLSLRTTWVTPATIMLSVAVAVIGGPAGIAALALGLVNHQLLLASAGFLASLVADGVTIVAIYGIRQRSLQALARRRER